MFNYQNSKSKQLSKNNYQVGPWSLNIDNPQQGQIILIALVFMAVVITVVVSLVGYASSQIMAHRQALAREQALNIAEAGAELAIWKLNNQPGYSGESNTAYAGGIYNVTITNLSGSSKLIRVDSYEPNISKPVGHRSIQITVTTGTKNVGFNYGLQTGLGGLEMSNSSKVVGNVYSNGDILGHNSATITGSAIAATAGGNIDGIRIDGNADAHTITDSDIGGNSTSATLSGTTVDGNAVSDSITNCTISGNATYDTKSSCNIAGTQTTPNPDAYTDPDPVALPISDAQVAAWEQEAADGGTSGSQSYNSGVHSLGPVKINGDLTVSNSAVLNVTGTIWVTGQIVFQNSSVVQLDPGYGSLSGVILAGTSGSTTAGKISLLNSTQANGSGTAGSYIMLLSEMNNTTDVAIDAGNTGTVAILYAGYGRIDINNSGQFKEITAAKVTTGNSATITYESGLANAFFSSGPSGGWEYKNQTWQLLQ